MKLDALTETASLGGGSAAARAYRAEMGITSPVQEVAKASKAQPHPEARAAIRKKLSGRVRLTFGVGTPTDAKVIDMSVTGICLLVEQMVHAKTPCTLACNIFHEGKAHVFSLRAVAVYSVLASGQGFKVGFQFGPHDEAAAAQIAALMR